MRRMKNDEKNDETWTILILHFHSELHFDCDAAAGPAVMLQDQFMLYATHEKVLGLVRALEPED